MGTRLQTLAALTDSPAGLAAWLLDHGDGYAQPAAAMTSAVLGRAVNGHSAGALTRDDVLDNITVLADQQCDLVGAALLGKQDQPLSARRRFDPGRRDGVSRREFCSAAELGGEGLSQADLLPPGRGRRPLRRVGTARDLQQRGSCRVSASAKFDLKPSGRVARAGSTRESIEAMSTPTKPTEPGSDHRHAAPTGQRQQRLPALPLALLTDEQKSLAANMKEEIARSFQGFVNVRDDGALLGPWNPWLHIQDSASRSGT
jgi:hypothetical protein